MSHSDTETKKVVTLVDKATKALYKSQENLQKTMDQLRNLVDQSNSLAFGIELKSQELASINSNIQVKEREAQADLQIRIKENENMVLDDLLANRKLAYISSIELHKLQADLSRAIASNQEEISKAVATAIAKAKATESLTITQLEAQHSVECAELKSENQALKSRINFLAESNDRFEKMLNEEREARVEISKNTSQPVVNVSSAK